jgi:glycosyltransferase involved in cell wall biosynthesis
MYYGHDLHGVRVRAQYEIEKDKKLLTEAEDWEKREKKLFSQVNVILTPSEKEKRIIQQMTDGNKPVIVLPPLYFDSFTDSVPFDKRKDMLFVGGFGHAPNADAVLWFVNEIMPRLSKDTRLIVAGSRPPEKILALSSERVIVKGFVSDEDLSVLYASCRVAVVPLRYGAGVKGKTIEAMHELIPVVSTSFSIEGLCEIEEIIPPRDDAESFAKEIMKFIGSNGACEEVQDKYRNWIAKWFSKTRAMQAIREMTGEGI